MIIAKYTYRLLRNPRDIPWGNFLLAADCDLVRGIRHGRRGWYISFEGPRNRTRLVSEFGQYVCDERRELILDPRHHVQD